MTVLLVGMYLVAIVAANLLVATYAETIGADSADGTVLKHDPSRPVHTWGPTVLAQPSLWRPK